LETASSLSCLTLADNNKSAFSAFAVHSGIIDQITDVDSDTKGRLAKFKADITRVRAVSDQAGITDGVPDPEFWLEVPQHKVSLGRLTWNC
jgi:hypothetical protein